MQCCGDPFKVGDYIDWWATNSWKPTIPIDAEEIDFCYESHSPNWSSYVELKGKIDNIKLLYLQYSTCSDLSTESLAVDGTLINTDKAVKWVDDMGNLRFEGYIIDIVDAEIRAATKDEIFGNA